MKTNNQLKFGKLLSQLKVSFAQFLNKFSVVCSFNECFESRFPEEKNTLLLLLMKVAVCRRSG